jgi:hypothetical protein
LHSAGLQLASPDCSSAERRRGGMSALVTTVPGVEDPARLAVAAAEFAASASLTVIPALPRGGRTVRTGPDVMELPEFLALASELGGGVLYLQAAPFGPGRDSDQPGSQVAHQGRDAGEIGQVTAAFAANGLLRFWEYRASGRT